MLHVLVLAGTIGALKPAVASVRISATVPLICRDYRVGESVVALCNDRARNALPPGAVPLGLPYLPGGTPLVVRTRDALPETAPQGAGGNAVLCQRCSFYR
jgi:hypothetical protein